MRTFIFPQRNNRKEFSDLPVKTVINSFIYSHDIFVYISLLHFPLSRCQRWSCYLTSETSVQASLENFQALMNANCLFCILNLQSSKMLHKYSYDGWEQAFRSFGGYWERTFSRILAHGDLSEGLTSFEQNVGSEKNLYLQSRIVEFINVKDLVFYCIWWNSVLFIVDG